MNIRLTVNISVVISAIFLASACGGGGGGGSSTAAQPTVTAESTSQADVQKAVDEAASGDIVQIPEGQSTWTVPVKIPDDKRITLRGRGARVTVIVSDMGTEVIDLNRSGSRVTGMGFKLGNTNGICIDVSGDRWRIDHCFFENTRPDGSTIEGVVASGNYTAGDFTAHPVGVVDHCEFYNTRVLVIGSLNRSMQNTLWNVPLGLGTNNAVFVEDCEFTRTHGNVIDSNYGGRYVFRYNKVAGGYAEAHAVQGDNRSARSWEIYRNQFTKIGSDPWVAVFVRGGTGVVFDNTFTGTLWNAGLAIDYRRSFASFEVSGIADGSHPWDGNDPVEHATGSHTGAGGSGTLTDAAQAWGENALKGMWIYNVSDGSKGMISANTATAITAAQFDGTAMSWDAGDRYEIKCGYPGRDQIGRAGDGALWTESNPCPPQVSDPVYGWNNVRDGSTMTFFVHNNCEAFLKEGRDYRNNVQKPGYSPYTYPHPYTLQE